MIRPPATRATFACPPDCGLCCGLRRDRDPTDARAESELHAELARHGIYTCLDGPNGLVVSGAEAAHLRERGVRVRLHPRTFLLEPRRREIVVVAWHLAHAPCVFLDGHRCTIYDERPLACRAFPVSAVHGAWKLASLCPEVPDARKDQRASIVSFPAFFSGEAEARRALETEAAAREARAWALLADARFRFRRGLTSARAKSMGERWRRVDVMEA